MLLEWESDTKYAAKSADLDGGGCGCGCVGGGGRTSHPPLVITDVCAKKDYTLQMLHVPAALHSLVNLQIMNTLSKEMYTYTHQVTIL